MTREKGPQRGRPRCEREVAESRTTAAGIPRVEAASEVPCQGKGATTGWPELPAQDRPIDDLRDPTDYTTHRKNAETRDGGETVSLVQQFVKVVVLATQAVQAFDPPFEDGIEPEWRQRVLREGFELQRDGYDMWELAEAVEARIVARQDGPYEQTAVRWLDGLRRTWQESSEAGLAPTWGPAPDGEDDFFVEDTELTMRDHWVREVRPMRCHNMGQRSAAAATRQDRSRTPTRNPETATTPQQRKEERSLLAGRVAGDGDATSFVVKKFLLKKKDSRSLRRLVDNPEAWRQGPGVTVTSSTRVLAPRASGHGRTSGSRGSSAPAACIPAPRGRGRGRASDRPIVVDDGEDNEEMDEWGASFLWRSLLGLETDSDYENEEPDRMPGFVNEPAYSTVYETLMDQPPQAFATMQESLPRFVELLHNDLRPIVDRVGAVVATRLPPPSRRQTQWNRCRAERHHAQQPLRTAWRIATRRLKSKSRPRKTRTMTPCLSSWRFSVPEVRPRTRMRRSRGRTVGSCSYGTGLRIGGQKGTKWPK